MDDLEVKVLEAVNKHDPAMLKQVSKGQYLSSYADLIKYSCMNYTHRFSEHHDKIEKLALKYELNTNHDYRGQHRDDTHCWLEFRN